MRLPKHSKKHRRNWEFSTIFDYYKLESTL